MAAPTWSVGQVLTASDVNTWFVDLYAYKTADTTRNTLSISTDPDLHVTLAPNAVYDVRLSVGYGASTPMSWNFTAPSGAGGGYAASFNVAGQGAATWSVSGWTGTNSAGAINDGILLEGMLSSGSGGTLGFQWASTSGPASLTVFAGSLLIARRIG